MVRDLLHHFQLAAVLQIRGDAGRAEDMIGNPRFDAGRFDIIVQTSMGKTQEREIYAR